MAYYAKPRRGFKWLIGTFTVASAITGVGVNVFELRDRFLGGVNNIQSAIERSIRGDIAAQEVNIDPSNQVSRNSKAPIAAQRVPYKFSSFAASEHRLLKSVAVTVGGNTTNIKNGWMTDGTDNALDTASSIWVDPALNSIRLSGWEFNVSPVADVPMEFNTANKEYILNCGLSIEGRNPRFGPVVVGTKGDLLYQGQPLKSGTDEAYGSGYFQKVGRDAFEWKDSGLEFPHMKGKTIFRISYALSQGRNVYKTGKMSADFSYSISIPEGELLLEVFEVYPGSN